MPNHITNIVTVNGSNASEVLSKYLNDDGQFDFNLVIPIPSEMDVEASSTVDSLAEFLRTGQWSYPHEQERMELWKVMEPEKYDHYLKLATQYNENVKKYGYGNWYEANCDIWGTKWNAYSQKYSPDTPNVV